jgi:hypothetical protein
MMRMLTEDKPPSHGAFGSFEGVQYDDDDVIDQWLASLTPDQFERVFYDLASLQSGPLSTLVPTG